MRRQAGIWGRDRDGGKWNNGDIVATSYPLGDWKKSSAGYISRKNGS